MAGPVVRESVTLAGVAERARVARRFVGGVLGSGHPRGDEAMLLVSELFGNSVRHSGSGVAGETVTGAVRAGSGLVRVEVTDAPCPGPRGGPRPGGAGGGGGGLELLLTSRPGGGGGGAAGGL
jgi:anti-sigma regulatory factor (Ser/Thr protein kinase)